MPLMMERLPYLRSASIGVFVKAGSIMETDEESGLSHFIEHMAFKGTANRSARQIAEEIDLIGGNVNAATSKLNKLLRPHYRQDLQKALNLLADMMINRAMRTVISEGTGGHPGRNRHGSGYPEDLVSTSCMRAYTARPSQKPFWAQARASCPRRDALNTFRRGIISRTVLSVVGRFDPQQLITWAEEAFGAWQEGA